MKKTEKFVVVLASVFCLVLLGGSVFAQGFVPPVPEMFIPPQTIFEYQANGWNTFEASWLIRHQITDTQGGYLGEISSLVIDNTNGRIALVVLSDVPHIGNKQLAIPFGSIMRTGDNTFEFNPGEMAIEMASPGYSDPYVYTVTRGPSASEFYGMPSAITPAWVVGIYRHYGQEPYWTQKGEQPLKDLELYQSTKLMGAKVQTPKGEEAGKVNDLVIDSPDGHIVFIVLSDIAEKGDALVAVPFSDLSRTGESVFVLNTTRYQLVSAPSFDEITDLSNLRFAENVYRYFGQHPYWMEGAGAVRPTTGQQIEEEEPEESPSGH